MRRNYQSEGEMTKGHDKGHKGQMSDREVKNFCSTTPVQIFNLEK